MTSSRLSKDDFSDMSCGQVSVTVQVGSPSYNALVELSHTCETVDGLLLPLGVPGRFRVANIPRGPWPADGLIRRAVAVLDLLVADQPPTGGPFDPMTDENGPDQLNAACPGFIDLPGAREALIAVIVDEASVSAAAERFGLPFFALLKAVELTRREIEAQSKRPPASQRGN